MQIPPVQLTPQDDGEDGVRRYARAHCHLVEGDNLSLGREGGEVWLVTQLSFLWNGDTMEPCSAADEGPSPCLKLGRVAQLTKNRTGLNWAGVGF